MDDDIQYRVKEFVAETARVRIGRLHSGTTLLCDLGIDGDDADDFFVAFRDHFDVDVSTLDLSKHFGPEGMPPWAPVVWLWNFFLKKGSPEEQANLTPIRISTLCEAVRLGRWVPEFVFHNNDKTMGSPLAYQVSSTHHARRQAKVSARSLELLAIR